MRYRTRECLGSGGFADVWAAEDTQRGTIVALKVLRVQDPTSRARFIAEARVLAACAHPCLMPILRLDQESSPPFIVMPYISGGSLAQYAGRLSVERACALMADVCAALRYLHARGIIHRDVKLDNILLQRNGRPLLGDLGIAHVPGEPRRTAQAIGTPGHLAPESINNPGRPTTAVDVYAVGASLYHLLTGTHPSEAAILDIGGGTTRARRELRALVLACSSQAPHRRPTLAVLEDHLRSIAAQGRRVRARSSGSPLGLFAVIGAVAGLAVVAALSES